MGVFVRLLCRSEELEACEVQPLGRKLLGFCRSSFLGGPRRESGKLECTGLCHNCPGSDAGIGFDEQASTRVPGYGTVL